MKTGLVVFWAFVCAFASVASAQEWDSVSYINHSTYQAVNDNGTTAYSGTYPIRLIGVVLSDNISWLSSASSSVGIGGQAEIYVQAVNLDGTAYDTDTQATYNDSNGTSCWIGQNYTTRGSATDYTEEQWYAELDRLGMWYEGSTLSASQLVQAGDLVEIRVWAGLNYKGKYNVNEQHNTDSSKDYEIVILQKNYGLPDASEIFLNELKESGNTAIFDATRQSGGEKYQSSLVELLNVEFTSVSGWGQNGDFTVTDGDGRTLSIHLGLDELFDTMNVPQQGQRYNITGILDQASTSGVYGTDGYRLLVLDPDYLVAVPEPATICLLSMTAVMGLLRKRKR